MILTQIKDKFSEIKIKLPKLPKINEQLLKSVKLATATAIPVLLAVTITANVPKANATESSIVTSIPTDLKTNFITEKVVAKAEISVGESEAERKKREARESASSVTIVASTSSTTVSYDLSLDEKRSIVQDVASRYSISWKLLEAVWQIESGKSTGGASTSYAGAQGPMQFLPSTWRSYGQDGNGDGVSDIQNVYDALAGGANYLVANGASSGDIDNALYRYNHSSAYVAKVKSIMNSI